MRSLSIIASVGAAVLALTLAAPASANSGGSGSCRGLDAKKSVIAGDLVDGLLAEVCGLVGKTVSKAGLEVTIPGPGGSVTAEAVGDGSGSAHYLRVDVSKSGRVSVVTEEPEAEHAQLTDGLIGNLLGGQSTQATAYSRCNDWTYATSAKFSPTTFYLNSSERRPGSVSKSAFESIAVASLGTWKNGSNGCGLTASLRVPGSVSYGNWTYDGNFTWSGGCGTRDGRNVIDWGPLSNSGTLGVTCTWSINGQPVEKDIRLDTSSRSWVTSTLNCSNAYDVRSVLTHELGHGLSLGHAAEHGADDLTMSPYVAPCSSTARLLGAGDVYAVQVQHGG